MASLAFLESNAADTSRIVVVSSEASDQEAPALPLAVPSGCGASHDLGLQPGDRLDQVAASVMLIVRGVVGVAFRSSWGREVFESITAPAIAGVVACVVKRAPHRF